MGWGHFGCPELYQKEFFSHAQPPSSFFPVKPDKLRARDKIQGLRPLIFGKDLSLQVRTHARTHAARKQRTPQFPPWSVPLFSKFSLEEPGQPGLGKTLLPGRPKEQQSITMILSAYREEIRPQNLTIRRHPVPGGSSRQTPSPVGEGPGD